MPDAEAGWVGLSRGSVIRSRPMARCTSIILVWATLGGLKGVKQILRCLQESTASRPSLRRPVARRFLAQPFTAANWDTDIIC